MSKKQLNEGVIDRIAESLFKLLFKNELKQAEDFAGQIISKMTDEQRKDLQEKWKNLTNGTNMIRSVLGKPPIER